MSINTMITKNRTKFLLTKKFYPKTQYYSSGTKQVPDIRKEK